MFSETPSGDQTTLGTSNGVRFSLNLFHNVLVVETGVRPSISSQRPQYCASTPLTQLPLFRLLRAVHPPALPHPHPNSQYVPPPSLSPLNRGRSLTKTTGPIHTQIPHRGHSRRRSRRYPRRRPAPRRRGRRVQQAPPQFAEDPDAAVRDEEGVGDWEACC